MVLFIILVTLLYFLPQLAVSLAIIWFVVGLILANRKREKDGRN